MCPKWDEGDDINVEYKFKDRRKAWFFAWFGVSVGWFPK
jgi:hypothetical protein